MRKAILVIILATFPALALADTAAEHVEKGYGYNNGKQYAKAIAEFQAALQTDSSFSKAQLGLAETFEHMGRLQEAIAAFEQYLKFPDVNRYGKQIIRKRLHELKKKMMTDSVGVTQGGKGILATADGKRLPFAITRQPGFWYGTKILMPAAQGTQQELEVYFTSREAAETAERASRAGTAKLITTGLGN